MDRVKLLALLIATTAEWKGEIEADPPKPLSETAKKLQELVPKFGCNAGIVGKAFSVLTGEDISGQPNEIKFKKFTVVVPVPCLDGDGDERRHHGGYALNEPVLICGIDNDGEAGGWAMNGDKVGNRIPPMFDAVRPATDVEIEEFMKRVPEETLRTAFEELMTLAAHLK